MTQEEKQLLLKDLCARLPYKTIIKPKKQDDAYGRKWFIGDISAEHERFTISYWQKKECGLSSGMTFYDLEDIVPYLRPMSSMTDEEYNKYELTFDNVVAYSGHNNNNIHSEHRPTYETFDYLDSIHVDYRDLIPKGLALPAPENMYKIR